MDVTIIASCCRRWPLGEACRMVQKSRGGRGCDFGSAMAPLCSPSRRRWLHEPRSFQKEQYLQWRRRCAAKRPFRCVAAMVPEVGAEVPADSWLLRLYIFPEGPV